MLCWERQIFNWDRRRPSTRGSEEEKDPKLQLSEASGYTHPQAQPKHLEETPGADTMG